MTGLTELFPHPNIRLCQQRVLDKLQESWHDTKFHVINMPTASGKSSIALTLARNCQLDYQSTVIVTPNNILTSQYTTDFPELATLSAMTKYRCHDHPRLTCDQARQKLRGFCKDCKYIKAKGQIATSWYSVVNAWTLLAHKLFGDVMIIDEAHKIAPLLMDRGLKTIWQREFGFDPTKLETTEDIHTWLDEIKSDRKRNNVRLRDFSKRISKDTYYPRVWKKPYRGKPQYCIDAVPLIAKPINDIFPPFWPYRQGIKKVVLMSATITPKDVEELGIDDYTYYECESPIPVSNRPIIYEPVCSMAYLDRKDSIPILAKWLDVQCETRKGKGMVHTSYAVAEELAKYLTHSRILTHNRGNKDLKFKAFLRSEDKVFVASGMSEGIDLRGDKAWWQVVTRVPYKSLFDPIIRAKRDRDPSSYIWDTAKELAQASGRVCRTPQDAGLTIITDSQFGRFWEHNKHFFPGWFREAVQCQRLKPT